MAIEKLSVILELVSGNYKREAREAATATGAIGSSAKSVTGSLGAMLGPAAIAGAVIGFGKMAVAAGENADRLFDLQAQTGLSTEALQEWEFVAKAAGATTEVFAEAVKAVIRNLSPTEGATGAAAKGYEALGIAVFDAGGKLRDAGDITDQVFTKLAGMSNITERNAIAQDIFGKKWEETISVLDLGSEALGNLREEGQKATISAASLAASDKFRETWQKFTATVGPKLNEVLGKLAPALTDITEEVGDAVDGLIPFVELIADLSGAVLKLRGDLNDMSESTDTWTRFVGDAVDVVSGILSPLGQWITLQEDIERLFREAPEAVRRYRRGIDEVHDSWNLAAIAAGVLHASLGPTITMLDRQYTSHRNVAKAAETQRQAMINLADFQASQLTPIGNIIRLQKDLAAAQEALAIAQADGKTPADELALAQLAVAESLLAVQGAGLALTPDQIQAFAQLLITQFGYSEQAALDTLEALNLLDGWTGTATFTLDMVTNASGGTDRSGNTINPFRDVFQFHTGGVVPGPPGSERLILAQAGETIIPAGQMVIPGDAGMAVSSVISAPTFVTHQGATIVVQSPMKDFRSDLQYATILASVTNLVEGG